VQIYSAHLSLREAPGVTCTKSEANSEAGTRATQKRTTNSNAQSIVEMITARGCVRIELFKQKEPELVEFFLKYVNLGFYNNLIFHRIIDGFMIQSGAYDKGFNNKEIQLKSQLTFKHIELKNNVGTIALILRKDNSAITAPQFFINLADNPFLNSLEGNYDYEVIGKIVSGMDVIEKIAHVKVGQREGMYNVPFYPSEAIIQELKQL
jgi:cyclophilin family peptidyl-prolyl cis-trans isomerase